MDRLNTNLYNENSTDSSDITSSEDDEKSNSVIKKAINAILDDSDKEDEVNPKNENIMFKIFNRERTGYFSNNMQSKYNQRAFSKVPNRLSFCLKDIVPFCYLQGHMFMGLTVCGQFLISYKVCYDENFLVSNYNFTTFYKYTLYFWIYRPHQPLSKYFKIVMFDDHGVDNLKAVTMTQWHSNPRVLILHGASECENEDSYITIVRVPKLGCADCREMREREFNEDGYVRCEALCIKCNLTIHSKYSTTESDPQFDPYLNLICPEKIILIANGFIHVLNIELENHKTLLQQNQNNHNNLPYHQQTQLLAHHKDTEKWFTQNTSSQHSEKSNCSSSNSITTTGTISNNNFQSLSQNDNEAGCDNKNNIVARIIADFSDFENETVLEKQNEINSNKTIKNYDEVIFTCSLSSTIKSPNRTSLTNTIPTQKSPNTTVPSTKVNLLNHMGKRNHRIVTKSYRNGVTTIDLQAASTSSSSGTDKAAAAYEFSEDTEKCEKIGTFRKRRLADKKYEFSEDNSENIIPFTKARFLSNTALRPARIHRPLTSSHYHATGTGTVYLSNSSAQAYETTSHLHRASPSQGFRSPCGSPVGAGSAGLLSAANMSVNATNRLARSPIKTQTISHRSSPSHSFSSQPLSSSSCISPISGGKALNTLSPIQISVAKRSNFELGNLSPTNRPFLSPLRDENKVFEVPLSGGDGELSEKPVCSKKFIRRFVEENDAVSVITSEEDDCISPGYHTSLPMEVHGSCYSDMQMVSKTSYQQLCCPIVIITQHSFDLETFTYYVISNLCYKNNKIYDVFYDWACEIINVCPYSNSVNCMLMAHFTARDKSSTPSKNQKGFFHRKQYECRILFSWNMETGDWEVLDYGQLSEVSLQTKSHKSVKNGEGLTKIAKNLAIDIRENLNKMHNFAFNIKVLDSNIDKSKNSLVDLDNMIEFYRKRPKLNLDLSINSNNSEDSDDTTILDY